MESKHKVGGRAFFQPVIARIDARDNSSDETAIPVLIVGVSFTNYGKVLYDIALPDGEGGFYEVQPLRKVDSFFLVDQKEED